MNEWYSQTLCLTEFTSALRASGYDMSPSTMALFIDAPLRPLPHLQILLAV